MAFRFRDLVIEVDPGRWPMKTFTLCWIFSAVITDPEDRTDDPALILQQLKANLRQALEQIEANEKAGAAGEKPQTLAEANDLEQRLQGALEELRELKKDLK
jgi:hypothetical protein